MKKVISFFFAITMILSILSCKSSETSSDDLGNTSQTEIPTMSVTSELIEIEVLETDISEENKEQDQIATDMAELEAIGDVEVKNGILTVSITLPADFVGDTVTQELLDADGGENYQSAKLNEDGSVTYKMTKGQYRFMLESITKSFDDSFQEIIDDNETYGISKIDHNDSYTIFDVTLDNESVGFVDGFSTIMFYMYGGIYGIFSGSNAENIVVNFYGPSGNLIETANSADMAN
jgi:hypothetical protein